MSAASRITELRSDKYSFSSMNYTIASAITNSNSDLAFCDCYRTIRRMADKIPLTEQALKLKALVDQAGGLVPFAEKYSP